MSEMYLADVFYDVSHEANAARNKFGEQTGLSDLEWFAVLAEEFGEVAMDITKRCVPPVGDDAPTEEDLIVEVIQVAAVAMRWLRAIDNRRGSPALAAEPQATPHITVIEDAGEGEPSILVRAGPQAAGEDAYQRVGTWPRANGIKELES